MIQATSIDVILGWMTLAALLSWLAPERSGIGGIAACGVGLLACLSPVSLTFLVAATIGTYWAANTTPRSPWLNAVIVSSIVAVYLVILWFAPIGQNSEAASFLLPLGMSYYVLRLIHYMLESDRSTFRTHTFGEYACYQFFPATLPVGPIHRFDDFLKQLRRRRWDAELFSAGASRVLCGALKIIVLANYLLNAKLAPRLDVLSHGSVALTLYLATVRYWLNIYVQFSGYSDVALGFGAFMGFRLPENFNWPFVSRNIGQFWLRWHMSLAAWCRDYIYMPVLAHWRRPVLASTASMIVLGLWHAVSLHYLIWGLYHATGLLVWRRFDKNFAPWHSKLWRPLQSTWNGFARTLTLHFVMFSYPIANALGRM